MSLARIATLSPPRTRPADAPPPAQEIPGELRRGLDWLRAVTLRQAARPRVDLFHACAMIDHRDTRVAAASAEALMGSLRQSLGRAPRIYRPGTQDVSFDERWLTAALFAARTGDAASLTFLIARRIRPEARRATQFLLNTLARHLDTV